MSNNIKKNVEQCGTKFKLLTPMDQMEEKICAHIASTVKTANPGVSNTSLEPLYVLGLIKYRKHIIRQQVNQFQGQLITMESDTGKWLMQQGMGTLHLEGGCLSLKREINNIPITRESLACALCEYLIRNGCENPKEYVISAIYN